MGEETIRKKVLAIYQEVASDFFRRHEEAICKEVIKQCNELDQEHNELDPEQVVVDYAFLDSPKGSYRERLANFLTEEEAKQELKDRIMHIPDSRERNKAIKANEDLFMYGGKK